MTPELVVQNIAFADGNSTGERFDGGGGGAIFFVSNDRTGTVSSRDSTLTHNPNDAFHTAGLPGIFFLGARRTVRDSILQ